MQQKTDSFINSADQQIKLHEPIYIIHYPVNFIVENSFFTAEQNRSNSRQQLSLLLADFLLNHF
jgi:hypothetical protein